MEGNWIALLRAVNVGGRNKVPMARLREVLEAAGCTEVQTYIASGNVVFRKEAGRKQLAAELEKAIEAEFGVRSTVVLRTRAELRTTIRSHPFGDDTSQTHVTFLVGKPTAAQVRALAEADIAPDEVEVVGSDVYLRYPNGVQGSKLTGPLLEKRLGIAGTNRNWRTVTRLAEMAGD